MKCQGCGTGVGVYYRIVNGGETSILCKRCLADDIVDLVIENERASFHHDHEHSAPGMLTVQVEP
jgi:hypothetical protein